MQIRHLIVKDFKILKAGKLNLVPPVDPISNRQTITHTLTLRPEAQPQDERTVIKFPSCSVELWPDCYNINVFVY